MTTPSFNLAEEEGINLGTAQDILDYLRERGVGLDLFISHLVIAKETAEREESLTTDFTELDHPGLVIEASAGYVQIDFGDRDPLYTVDQAQVLINWMRARKIEEDLASIGFEPADEEAIVEQIRQSVESAVGAPAQEEAEDGESPDPRDDLEAWAWAISDILKHDTARVYFGEWAPYPLTQWTEYWNLSHDEGLGVGNLRVRGSSDREASLSFSYKGHGGTISREVYERTAEIVRNPQDETLPDWLLACAPDSLAEKDFFQRWSTAFLARRVDGEYGPDDGLFLFQGKNVRFAWAGSLVRVKDEDRETTTLISAHQFERMRERFTGAVPEASASVPQAAPIAGPLPEVAPAEEPRAEEPPKAVEPRIRIKVLPLERMPELMSLKKTLRKRTLPGTPDPNPNKMGDWVAVAQTQTPDQFIEKLKLTRSLHRANMEGYLREVAYPMDRTSTTEPLFDFFSRVGRDNLVVNELEAVKTADFNAIFGNLY